MIFQSNNLLFLYKLNRFITTLWRQFFFFFDHRRYKLSSKGYLCFFCCLITRKNIRMIFSDSFVHRTASTAVIGHGYRFSTMVTLATFFFQPMIIEYFSSDNQIWGCGLVVKSVGSGEVFADEYCRACCCSNAFSLDTTVTLQSLIYVPSMDLIDSWHQKYPRDTPDGFVQFGNFTQSKCCLIIKGICSTWLIFWDKLSPHQVIGSTW